MGGFKRFTAELFQDIDGGFSLRELLTAICAVVFFAIILYVVHYGIAVNAAKGLVYSIPQQTLDFLTNAMHQIIDLIKWLAGAAVLDRAPQAVAAFKGNKTPAPTQEP